MLAHWSDYLSITWNYFFGSIGVVLNLVLIVFVFKYTPPAMRVYATVIQVGAFCDFIYSFAAVMLSTRVFAVSPSLILMFHGAINYFPSDRNTTPYICFSCYVFGVNSYLVTLLVILFSIYYRQRIVTNPQGALTRFKVNCILYGFSLIAIAYTTFIVTRDLPTAYDIDEFIGKSRPELIGSGWIYFVLFNAGGFSEWMVICMNWIVLTLGIICRVRVHKKLASLNMSSGSKELQKALMDVLLVQIITAFVPIFTLVLHTMAITWNEIQTPLIENTVLLLPMLLPSITPIATLYLLKPYRNAIKLYFGKVENVTPIHVSERIDSSTQQF